MNFKITVILALIGSTAALGMNGNGHGNGGGNSPVTNNDLKDLINENTSDQEKCFKKLKKSNKKIKKELCNVGCNLQDLNDGQYYIQDSVEYIR